MASLYWRLVTTQAVSGSTVTIGELGMFENGNPASLTTGGIASASAGTAANAFDGNPATVCTGSQPHSITYQFASPVDIDYITITVVSVTSTNPRIITIQKSDNGSDWDDVVDLNISSAGTELLTKKIPITQAESGVYNLPRPIESEWTGFKYETRYFKPFSFTDFSGDGSFKGQIFISGTPTPGKVTLYHSDTQQIVKSVETNSLGEYQIDNLNRKYSFDLIATVNNEWEKKISSRRVPVWLDPQFSFNSYEGVEATTSKISPAYPYWRLYIIDGGSHGSIMELEMAESEGGPNLCVGGSYSASSQFDGVHGPEYAFDGIKTGASPAWAVATGQIPAWIRYNLPEEKAINSVRITSRGSPYANQTPVHFIIQSSDDGVYWNNEWTVEGQVDWGNNETREFVRPGIVSLVPIAVTQSSQFSDVQATIENMSDGDFTTGGGTNSSAAQWIKLDLGSSKTVSSVTVAGGNIPNWGGAVAPYLNGAEIEFSNDDTNWTYAATISGVVDTSGLEEKEFTFSPVSARYWRITMGGYLATTEFKLGN